MPHDQASAAPSPTTAGRSPSHGLGIAFLTAGAGLRLACAAGVAGVLWIAVGWALGW